MIGRVFCNMMHRRLGRQPNRSYRSAEYGPLPLVAQPCKKVNDLEH